MCRKKGRVSKTNRAFKSHFIYKQLPQILLILFFAFMVFAAVEDAGVIYYSFDSGTVTGDDIDDIMTGDYAAENHGATSVNGLINEAFEFISGNSEFINSTWTGSSRTITFWVNTTQTTGGIMGQRYDPTETDGDWSFQLDGSGNGRLVFYECDGGNCDCLVSAGAINDGSYHFITLVANDSSNKLEVWRDGSLITEEGTCSVESYDGGPFGSGIGGNNSLQLGRFGEDGWTYFTGMIDEFGLWNVTLNEQNISDLYNAGSGYQPSWAEQNLTIQANDTYLGLTQNIFIVTINNTNYTTTDGTIETDIPLTATDTKNITIYTTNYFNRNYPTYDISASGNLIGNLTFNMSRHNITAFVQPQNSTQLTDFNVTASSGHSGTTDNGSIIIETPWNTTTIVGINASGYQENALWTTYGNLTNAHPFYLFTKNSFSINIRNETLRDLITGQNVTIELISDTYNSEATIHNGTYIFDLLTPESYKIRYISENYYERIYYQTLVNGSHNELDLYLLDQTLDTDLNVTVTVVTNLNDELEGAELTATRYYNALGSYVTTEKTETNFEGKTQISLVNDEFYIFYIDYGGERRLTTEPTYVYDEELTFVIDIGEDPTDDFYNEQDIFANITYNTVTDNFRYEFDDPQNRFSETCLRIFTHNILDGATLYNESCLTTHTGTILLNAPENNGTTYEARANALIDGDDTLLTNMFWEYKEVSGFGDMGLLLIIFLTLVFAFIGFWSPVVALLLTPIPLVIGAFTGILAIPTAVAIGVVVGFGIIALAIGRNG